MALLTTEQRQWIDLQKLIKRQRPAKRPKVRPQGVFREWCYDRAVRKHGFWARFMTVFYVFHILVLMYVYILAFEEKNIVLISFGRSQTFSNSVLDDIFRSKFESQDDRRNLIMSNRLNIFIRFAGLRSGHRHSSMRVGMEKLSGKRLELIRYGGCFRKFCYGTSDSLWLSGFLDRATPKTISRQHCVQTGPKER